MGCCISSAKSSKKSNPDVIPPNHLYHLSKCDEDSGGSFPPQRSPPPSEEETVVKEVLSETPIPKPPNSIPIQINNNDKINIDKHKHQHPEIEEEKLVLPAVAKSTDEMVSEVSEVSDLFSFSGSFSTTTVNEKREDDGEVTQIIRSPAKIAGKRPNAGEFVGRKERGPRSPAQRRNLAQSRTAMIQRGNVVPANGVRRDPAEGSIRRSRSPATRGEAPATRAGRHKIPSSSNVGRFVAPVPAPAPAVAVNGDNVGKLCKGNVDVSAEAGEVESLENPLVSFECFIFL